VKTDGKSCCAPNSTCCAPKGSVPKLKKETGSKRLEIEFLYLDLSVCAPCQGTDASLEEAIVEVANVLKAIGVEVVVRKINVLSEEQARELKFVSSPTIRINGRDIQLDVKESLCESCGDLCGDDVDCRVWVYQGHEYTVPPKAMIIEAILREVYGGGKEVSNDTQWQGDIPDNLKRFFAARRKKENTMKTTLKIEWRHLDVEGETCNRCYDTGENLNAEVKRLNRMLEPQGIKVEWFETKLDDTQIPQSNTILFNGVPIEDILNIEVSENYCDSCTSLLGTKTYCRTVMYDGIEFEDVPAKAIRQAALKVLGLEETPAIQSGCNCNGCC